MFIIPYRVEVSIRRWPVGNLFILGLLLVCYRLELAQLPAHIKNIVPFVLTRDMPFGLVGYMFLHGGILHLAGNMLFLWVFGNAVCVRVGNLAYPFIFLALGVVAGLAHLSMSAAPAIGASGAINGIVGMFLVWFPTNYMSVFYLWPFGVGTFRVRSYWMIPFWLVFDILGAALGLGRRGVLGASGRIRGRVRAGGFPSQARPGPDGAAREVAAASSPAAEEPR